MTVQVDGIGVAAGPPARLSMGVATVSSARQFARRIGSCTMMSLFRSDWRIRAFQECVVVLWSRESSASWSSCSGLYLFHQKDVALPCNRRLAEVVFIATSFQPLVKTVKLQARYAGRACCITRSSATS